MRCRGQKRDNPLERPNEMMVFEHSFATLGGSLLRTSLFWLV
jgi:hypothetical protein